MTTLPNPWEKRLIVCWEYHSFDSGQASILTVPVLITVLNRFRLVSFVRIMCTMVSFGLRNVLTAQAEPMLRGADMSGQSCRMQASKVGPRCDNQEKILLIGYIAQQSPCQGHCLG